MSIKRGEIYFVNLNPVKGKEQAGKRPVLVLSIDPINQLPLVVTVVVGTKGENISRDYPTNVRVSTAESGLPLETVFLGFQIRSLDLARFTNEPAGRLTKEKMSEIETVVRYCLGL
ncbi:MAG: type II toxin-antitoxin system PemK/MazF family toxin [Cyanobacteria bacterium P01_G01_bin.19]